MSQRHRLVLQFRLTWLPQLPQESHLRHSGFPHHHHHHHLLHHHHHHHHHLLHHHHHHRHDCHQHQYNLQVILHVVQHSPIRDVVSFSKQKLFPIDLQLQAIVIIIIISILVVIFLTNLHPHQAIGVHIIISDEVFRAISVGFKTVGVFKIIRSNQFISCSPVRGKIFAQIFVWNSESRSVFQIVIIDDASARRVLEIVIRNTPRRSVQREIIASFIVGHKTL